MAILCALIRHTIMEESDSIEIIHVSEDEKWLVKLAHQDLLELTGEKYDERQPETTGWILSHDCRFSIQQLRYAVCPIPQMTPERNCL